MERFEGASLMSYRGSNTPVTASGLAKLTKKKLYVVDKHMKKPTRKDLVYLDESPDYCERNQT